MHSTNHKKPIAAAITLVICSSLHAAITEDGPNYTTYPISSIPTVGLAGSIVYDPVFGTKILRLTDSADGNTSCRNMYSYWPVFNKDSTRIAVTCVYPPSGTDKTILYTFNPSSFTATNPQTIPYLGDDMIWSALDANVIYTRSGAGGGAYYGPVFNSYNVATGIKTVVKDFSTILPSGYGLNQMSHSMDDDIWAFTKVDGSGHFVGYLVWKKSTNTILLNQNNSGSSVVDEVQIDKSGRYLSVQNYDPNNTSNQSNQIWDLQNQTAIQLTHTVDAYVHEDTGYGTVVSDCGTWQGLCFRKLSSPKTVPTVLPLANWSQAEDHFTMLADNESWALVTNENPNLSVTLPFHGEIFQVATNGSGRVRHLVHHNSTVASYDHSAMGNISRDGQFIAWTSDWGVSSGRTDVYIGQITPAQQIPGPISGPTQTLSASTAASDTGYAYLISKTFGTPADNGNYLTRSILRLFEDGYELKPPHSAHADIRTIGVGRFSHWSATDGSGESVRFSSLDNSDVRINGKTYRYNVPNTQISLDVSGATSDSGYAYMITKPFGNRADNSYYSNQSTLRLFENGVELQPHSLHADIRTNGHGLFSHWSQTDGSGEALRFSSSDNTDPRTNGRTYTYIIDTILPLPPITQ